MNSDSQVEKWHSGVWEKIFEEVELQYYLMKTRVKVRIHLIIGNGSNSNFENMRIHQK